MSSVTKKTSAMGDKLNQKNNSADNNLGHFFKATDIDDIAMTSSGHFEFW